MARTQLRTTYKPYSKTHANEWLKTLREKMSNVPGNSIDAKNNENFDWVAYIASRPNAEEILEFPIIDFRAEVFPELDPNRDKMPRNPYRVDLLCIRENGSGVRLHPHKHGKEEIHFGDLEAWRAGLWNDI